jgi:acetyl esterase/lipase
MSKLSTGLFQVLALAASLAAPAAHASCQTISGVTYGTYVDGNGQTQPLALDLVLPAVATPTPLVVWIHGGGWLSGSRTPIPSGVTALCSRGYAVASVDYRLTTTAIWPAQIQDVKGAVRFLRAHAGTYNLDPDRFAAWGTSAGGHLAAMLGTAGDVPMATVGNITVDLEGSTGGNLGVSSRVQAAVDWYGATDVLQMYLYASTVDHNDKLSAEGKLLGGAVQQRPELAATANPVTYVSADDPPFLVMHGTIDDTNPFNQSELLVDALRANGVPVTFVPVEGAGHGFMTTPTEQTTYDFLDSVLAHPQAVTLGVTASLPSASEAGGRGRFTLTRSGDTGSTLAAHWIFKGTANLGADFEAPLSVVFLPGETSETVDVTPVEDTLVEGDESAVLTIRPDPSYRVDSSHTAATVTIADDESPAGLPAVTVAASAPTATEGGAAGTFTVSRTGDTSADLTVLYSLSGTATPGVDYASLGGSLTIPVGQASATVTVSPLADTVPEPSETVILTLSTSDPYALGSPATASVAIFDVHDGAKPIVSTSATDPTASESGGNIADNGAFTLSRTGSTTAALTVDLILSGTAQEGTDYATVTTPVTFPANASRVVVTIDPLSDSSNEAAETVHLAASGPAILAGPYVATVTLIEQVPVAGYYTVLPCRIVDTRQGAGPQGGPALAAGSSRVFTVGGFCGIPSDASTVSLNVTVVGPAAAGFLTLYPAGAPRPTAAALNFTAGQVRTNNSIVPLSGMPPGLSIYYGAATGQADVILDVNGYFR